MTSISGFRPKINPNVRAGDIEQSSTAQTDNAQEVRTDSFGDGVQLSNNLPVGNGGAGVGSDLATRSLSVSADRAHAAITNDLFRGKVVHAEPFGANGNLGNLFKVKLHNPKTGNDRWALFKPREYGDRDGWCRPPIEYVSYELNRMLDMDLIAPVAYRRNIDVNFEHYDEGAMMYLVPDCHRLNKVDSGKWGMRQDLFLSDTRIMDVLIQNCDRHPGNFGRGKHWADGKYRPMLIDQDAGFRPQSHVTMEHENAFLTGPAQVVRKKTLEGLKRLNFDQIKEKVGEFLSDREISDVLGRSEGIVKYFENLAAQNGYSNVVIDDNN